MTLVPLPFRSRAFRSQWLGDLLTSWSFEIERLILGWYILVETKSVVMLTLFGAMQYGGTLVAPLVGVLGDRIGPRRVLATMRLCYAVCAGTLLAVAWSGRLTPTIVLFVGAIAGLVIPSDIGMRGALIAETQPREQLMAAMGAGRTTSDTARIGGALAGAGLISAFGIVPTYFVVTCTYVASALLTLRAVASLPLEAGPRPERAPTSPWSDLKEGLAYVWTTPHVLGGMAIACLVNLTAFPIMGGVLPYVAKEVYGLGQTGLGYLSAAIGVGAFIGSIAVGMAGMRIAAGRVMLIATIAWYLLLLALALVTDPRAGALLLMLVGLAQSFSMVPLAVMLLRTSEPRFRGRVMSVRMLAIYSLPFGLLGAGALIERFGFKATGSAYALLGLATTLAIAIAWRRALWTDQAPGNAR
ncbi:MAG TPA: MFS transporter [Hyphomicrobiaceae bacterium]|nr:MFS transporter [Hyphomicrobiaceae bacterium]